MVDAARNLSNKGREVGILSVFSTWREWRAGGVLDAPPSARRLPQLGTRTGYLLVAGLVGLLMGLSLVGGLMQFGYLLAGVPYPEGGVSPDLAGVVVPVAAIWLLALVVRDKGRRWARVQTAGAFALGLFGVGLVLFGDGGATADGVRVIGLTVVGLWLCVAMVGARGISAGQLGIAPRWAANRRGRIQAVAVWGIAYGSACAASVVMALLQAMSWLPQMRGSQTETMAITSAFEFYARASTAAFSEEPVLLAVVVVLLMAARRPLWEIYAVALTARLVIHLYFGGPALAVLVFTSVHVWLFIRTRRLTPLIFAHLAYNLTAALGGMAGAGAIRLIGVVTLLAGALVMLWNEFRTPMKKKAGESAGTAGAEPAPTAAPGNGV